MVVASLKITVLETENLQPAVEYMTCNVLKKVQSSCPGQVDYYLGQVTFHAHLPNEQGPQK